MPSSIQAIVKPELLVWARKTSGLDQSMAAKKLKIPIATLQEWENGSRTLSIAKLRKLATLYKRPLSVFYLSEVPTTFEALHDFRRLPDGTSRPSSPELILEVRKAVQRREIALELLETINEPILELGLWVNATDNPDQVANEIRDFLGITLDTQFKWSDDYEALNGWKNAVEKAGVLVFQSPRVPVDEMRGISINEKILPVIVLNGLDATRAKIFTLIHEFTHLSFHNGGICDLNDIRMPLFEDPTEVFCNRVAGAVLVPAISLIQESLVRTNRGRDSWTDIEISQLADKYWVSSEALLRRLVIVGAATEDFYRKKREGYNRAIADIKKQQKLKQKEKGVHVPHFRMVVRNNGTRYTRLVLNAYYEDAISASELSDFLDVKLSHLGSIEKAVFSQTVG